MNNYHTLPRHTWQLLTDVIFITKQFTLSMVNNTSELCTKKICSI